MTRRAQAFTVAVAMLAAFALIGCSGNTPSADPAIRGNISSISRTPDGVGAILVEGPIADGTTLDKAALAITADTQVVSAAGKDVDPETLEVGMRVEVWITGPVRESYPVQADAAVIEILE